MKSPRPARLYGIEVGRGIAATSVVLYHVSRHLKKVSAVSLNTGIFQFGHAGVDFFFVISGFIILFIHYDDVGRPKRLNHYIGRRLTRILPIYWLALAATVVLDLGGHHGMPSLSDLGWSALLLPSNAEPVLGVAWTLQYEIVFYAAFCLLIASRALGLALLAIWFLTIVLAEIYGGPGGTLPHSLYSMYNVEFFLGMAVAIYLRNRGVARPTAVLVAGLGLFAAAAIAETAHVLNGYGDVARLAYGIPAALIVLGTAERSRSGAVNVPMVLRKLGSASYSIYLFQFVFIGVLWKLLLSGGLDRRLPHPVIFVILGTGAVIGGVAMSQLFEYPLMRLVRGDRRRNPGAALSS